MHCVESVVPNKFQIIESYRFCSYNNKVATMLSSIRCLPREKVIGGYSSQSWVEIPTYLTVSPVYYSNKHLPQSPFTCKFFIVDDDTLFWCLYS